MLPALEDSRSLGACRILIHLGSSDIYARRGRVQDELFSCVTLEKRVPSDRLLHGIRRLTDVLLRSLGGEFDGLYASSSRPSIPLGPRRRASWNKDSSGYGDGTNFHGEKRSKRDARVEDPIRTHGCRGRTTARSPGRLTWAMC